MGRYYRVKAVLAVAVVLAVGILGFLLTSGPPPAVPDPPGTFSFAVLGDSPYSWWEEMKYQVVRQDLDQHDLRWVLHVGDIFWQPCTEKRYRKSLDQFNRLRHPVIYTPGDNEWTDCWEPGSGAYQPEERLDHIRKTFFSAPDHSLGGRRLPLVSQARKRPFSDLVENVRWTHAGLLFATVNLPGSRNGLEPFPGRTAADDTAARRRTEAATAWVRETFAAAKAGGATAVVIGFHANPAFEEPAGDPYRQAYEPFLAALEEEVERYGKPVLVVQGDDHVYTVDHPLVRRTTGRRLKNFTRMQVPGSPEVGWVRVVVTPGAEPRFTFEARVVPGWKYW